jgi:membrane protein YdbS with pleckstrin-like domain
MTQYLLPHESPVVTVRQHPAVVLGSAAVALVGLVAAAILGVVWHGNPGLEVAVWAAWALLAGRLIFKALGWATSYFMVTSQRVMMVTGLVTRFVQMIPLSRLNDISVRRSPGGLRLGYGELFVRQGGPKAVLQKFQYMPYPEQLCLEIRGLIGSSEQIPCPVCHGEGEASGDEQPAEENCSECDGWGWVPAVGEPGGGNTSEPAGNA